ncbi:MAG: hypothetical protein IKF82_00290 [Bacilli bacterium]|nr:hypothetical protein [Bacilli bacterium]
MVDNSKIKCVMVEDLKNFDRELRSQILSGFLKVALNQRTVDLIKSFDFDEKKYPLLEFEFANYDDYKAIWFAFKEGE